MRRKQNIFYTHVLNLVVMAVLCIGMPTSLCADDSKNFHPKTAEGVTLPGPFAVIDAWMTHVRTRDRDHAFSLLSNTLHEKYGDSARVFMNTLRLTQHAIYDHETYRLLTPVTQMGAVPSALIKIQLRGRDGAETLGIVRVLRVKGETWKIDGMTILNSGRARDA